MTFDRFFACVFGFGKIQDCGTKGRMDTNDSLRVASLWHSMHAISQQLSPVNGCSGIELLEADTFDLHCFQSLPGKYPSPFNISSQFLRFMCPSLDC